MGESKKRIALFLDGTWNSINDNTNIWRVKSLCSPVSDDGCVQITYYDIGVNGFWGGACGRGLGVNVIEAYQWLQGQYAPGDEIFIFGFSRGAYTARSLAGLIAKHGLLKPGAPLGTGQIYDRYRRTGEQTIWKLASLQEAGKLKNPTLEENWMLKYTLPVSVKMVAVWDTVGALGVPSFDIPRIGCKPMKFLHTGLRLPIENGFHAIAIDEHRRVFSPTLWTVREGIAADPRPLSSVEQRWFVGAHGNVGGGYFSDLLAQRPLQWIVGKAADLGLTFRYAIEPNEDSYEAPINDSFSEFFWGAYPFISERRHRTIGGPPTLDDRGTHHTVNETIDRSVFERWRRVSNYRPPSLVTWADRLKVKPETLKGSVLAHDPNTGVDATE